MVTPRDRYRGRMAGILLGPLLRYVDETQASIWVETDAACEVEVLGRKTETFCIQGHHYGLVFIEDLEPGSSTPYEVRLDGEPRWPEPDSGHPPSLIRTIDPEQEIRIAFGSCRVTAPHDEPWCLSKDEDEGRGRGNDALRTYGLRMLEQDPSEWPQIICMLGDQVYADEDAPQTRAFISQRRDITEPPHDEVADFEEYTQLYRESWSDPTVRWLLSTVGSTMLFDDHDVHDDWNTSIAWLEEIRKEPWWDKRIRSALVAYWCYQHLGNLSPKKLEELGLLPKVCELDDAWPMLCEWAGDADWGSEGRRWSYSRTLGDTLRLVWLDSREGRVLGEKPRKMFDDDEWDWLQERVVGGFTHVVVADTLPIFMPAAMQDLEAWDEAVAAGAWGPLFKGMGERIRRAIDLEHWGAFQHSFRQITGLLADVGAGRRGEAPASVITLGGDIHHAYLAEIDFPKEEGVRSPVWQAVCSPYRNPLDSRERRIAGFGSSRAARLIGRGLRRSAGVRDLGIRWELIEPPTFDNQIGTLTIHGRSARVRIERALPGPEPKLETSLDRELTGRGEDTLAGTSGSSRGPGGV